MTQLTNTFAGGTDGTTITTGNSGGASGDAFNGVDIPASAIVAYTNTQAYGGALSARCGTRGTGGFCGVNWSTSLGTPGDHYDRCFFRTDALPAGNDAILYAEGVGPVQNYKVRLLNSGILDIRNNADAQIAFSTTVLAINTWYRLELFVHQDAATGYVTLRIYTNPAAIVSAFTEELNAGGGTATWPIATTNYKAFQAGQATANFPSATGYVYYSVPVVGNPTTWNGPLPLPQVPHMYLARTAANF